MPPLKYHKTALLKVDRGEAASWPSGMPFFLVLLSSLIPQLGLTVSQVHVFLVYIQSSLLLHRRLSLLADIIISCSVVVVALSSRIYMSQFDRAMFPFARGCVFDDSFSEIWFTRLQEAFQHFLKPWCQAFLLQINSGLKKTWCVACFKPWSEDEKIY